MTKREERKNFRFKLKEVGNDNQVLQFYDSYGQQACIRTTSLGDNLICMGLDKISHYDSIKKMRAELTENKRIKLTEIPQMIVSRELAEELIEVLSEWLDYGVIRKPEKEVEESEKS